METPVKGDVVVVPFPFSSLADQKRRPALIISNQIGSDFILCQITSKRSNCDWRFSFLTSTRTNADQIDQAILNQTRFSP